MTEYVESEESFELAEKEGSYNSILDEVLLGLDGNAYESPEEPEPNCKRQKIDSCANMTGVPSPLGLNLCKTQTFLDLIHMKLFQEKTTPHNEPTVRTNIEKQKTRNDNYDTQPTPIKWKASNFPATKLKIGSWERESRNESDIVAKFYYAKRKLVWEILESGLKKKLEIQWPDISAIRARFMEDQPGILEVELRQQPMFFNEVNPQPRKHTNWEACSDFTGGNATIYRRHHLEFPEGILEKHYERLLCGDNRLLTMSQRAFPSHDSSFFETIRSEMQDVGMLNPRFPPSFNQLSSNWYPPHLHYISNHGSMNGPTCIQTFDSLGPSVGANYSVSLLKPAPEAIHMNSPSSVVEFPPTMYQATSALNPGTSYLDDFALNNANSTMNPILSKMTQICNQEIQSLRGVDDIREHQTQQLYSGAYAATAPNFLPRHISADNSLTHATEIENSHAGIQDLQSIEEQLLSDSSDLDAFVSDESRLLSKVNSVGSLLFLTAVPDSQP
ncbi:uncharacterized protein [Elaeis guineensis]|uniref:uncharacterized protein n=1 Tax=Elaeis guineensis var. tenera TaxID=51953 RepID=UPI003C6DAAB1